MVAGSLAVVTDELEAAEHLTNSEEAEALGEDNTASNELGSTNVADLLEELLGRREEGAGAERAPKRLVVGLESGDRTASQKS